MDSIFDKPVLNVRNISKRFAGVQALSNVDFNLYTAEVVALIGENGAGKSTLMKILGGIHQPDAGELYYNGDKVIIADVRQSIDLGIGFIHQELSVLDNLDIAGNMFLGHEPVRSKCSGMVDNKKLYEMADPYLEMLGLNLSPRTLMKDLSIAQQQIVEIAKALSLDACVLIMDEPTSSLTMSETFMLFDIIQQLKNSGVSIIYISHRLNEIEVCSDRVIGLRDGENSGELAKDEIKYDNMVRLMVGRDIKIVNRNAKRNVKSGGLKVERARTALWPDCELSFEAAPGEILGITGLVGAGRTELACSIFGVNSFIEGKVYFDNELINIRNVLDAVKNGIYLIPEDRKNFGLITDMSVMQNLTLPNMGFHSRWGLVSRISETSDAENQCMQANIKTANLNSPAESLSGGNQQKIVLSKWLSLNPRVVILDEPTRGVDVGSKSEIYDTLRELADQGIVVLVISSDMEEIMSISDRILVMHEGRISGTLQWQEFSEETIMNLAVGNNQQNGKSDLEISSIDKAVPLRRFDARKSHISSI